jgi:predicted Zn-dependent protease with MMP-like domain
MNQNNRTYFDQQVEWVLTQLPQNILRLVREVPLHVEDQPSKRLMRELNIEDAEELCGYFSGVPHGAGNVYVVSAPMPNNITIFRRGIVAEARDEEGRVRRSELREQIRITILHELAHLLGMDEKEVEEIGYA